MLLEGAGQGSQSENGLEAYKKLTSSSCKTL
jgi:hypothetical protein